MKTSAPQEYFQPAKQSLGRAPAFSQDELQANHARLLERNAVHHRFGFDAETSVRFVLEKALPLRGRVLDIGTGKGRFVIPLAKQVGHVTTVDINAEEQHCAWLEALHVGVAERIDFVRADARALPWPAASFDAVASWNVFHHLDDPERVFAEMLRVLRLGGKIVLADFSPSGFRVMDEIHGAEGKRHPHPPSRFPHWRACLQNRGFCLRRFVNHHEEVLVAQRCKLSAWNNFAGAPRAAPPGCHWPSGKPSGAVPLPVLAYL